jgi:hypothetical protein
MRRIASLHLAASQDHAITWRALAWLALGMVSAAIGVINAFLPLLPTTVFLLISLWAFGKGAPEWRQRLLAHPRWGGPLQHWGAGPPRVSARKADGEPGHGHGLAALRALTGAFGFGADSGTRSRGPGAVVVDAPGTRAGPCTVPSTPGGPTMVQAVLRLTQHIRVSPIRRLFGFGITVSGLVLLVRDLMTALVHLP